MTRFKVVTHWIAVAFTAATVFAASDAGQALIRQYPKLSAVATLLGLLGALYHSPKTPA